MPPKLLLAAGTLIEMRRQTTGAAALVALAAIAVAAVASVFQGERGIAPDPIEQALEMEEQGHVNAAEQRLLEIAAEDRRYAPRWTLANFYFRQGRKPEFWRWAREAFAVGNYEMEGLMDLCWSVSNDGNEVWAVIPRRLEVWRPYLRYLSEQSRWVAAVAPAEKIAEEGSPEDAAGLLDWADKIAESGQAPLAVRAWNNLCGRRIVACSASVDGVTNGAFATEPMGRGLDWRFVANAGVTPRWEPGTVRFRFDASAPASGDLMWQPAAGASAVTADLERSGSLEQARVEWVAANSRVILRYSKASNAPGQLAVKQARAAK